METAEESGTVPTSRRNASQSLIRSVLSFLSVLSVFLSVSSYAQSVPTTINWQGRLTDSSGNPLNGSQNFVFSIWSQSSGGSSLWCEAKAVTAVNGAVSTQLGSAVAISSAVFISASAYLDIDIGDTSCASLPSAKELSPRSRLVTVPYSFTAGSVVPEIAISTLDATQTTPYGGINVTTNVFVQGNVGIGTSGPNSLLQISTSTPSNPGFSVGSSSYNFVPAGMVSFFNLSSCPLGWTALTAAQGRYLVGVSTNPATGTLAASTGTALGDLENRPTGKHSHTITDPGHSHGVYIYTGASGSYYGVGTSSLANGTGGTFTTAGSYTGISVNSTGTIPGTNAPYIQLLVCQKN